MATEMVEYARFAELMDKWGYAWQAHQVYTEDDYILTTFQILGRADKGSILIMHGSMGDGSTWLSYYTDSDTKPL